MQFVLPCTAVAGRTAALLILLLLLPPLGAAGRHTVLSPSEFRERSPCREVQGGRASHSAPEARYDGQCDPRLARQPPREAHGDDPREKEPTRPAIISSCRDDQRNSSAALAETSKHGWLYRENLARRYPAMFRSSGQVADRRAGVADAVLRGSRFADDAAVPLPAADGHQAVVCLVQKAGSSRWKMMLVKALTGRATLGSSIHQRHAEWLRGVPLSRRIEQTESLGTVRIMFVRDPYSRLLSGFLDKACSGGTGHIPDLVKSEYGGPYEPTPAEFARFVQTLVDMRSQQKELNRHFSPLTEHCGLSNGMRYDLYLKVEEMDEWYPDVATFLGLTEAAGSGFNGHERHNTTQEGQGDVEDLLDCFYPLTGTTCKETSLYLERYRTDPNAPRPRAGDGPSAWQRLQTTEHAHGADRVVGEFYTEQVAGLAYSLVKGDLDAFGYPRMEFEE